MRGGKGGGEMGRRGKEGRGRGREEGRGKVKDGRKQRWGKREEWGEERGCGKDQEKRMYQLSITEEYREYPAHIFHWTAISHGTADQEPTGRRIEQFPEMLDGPHSLGRHQH